MITSLVLAGEPHIDKIVFIKRLFSHNMVVDNPGRTVYALRPIAHKKDCHSEIVTVFLYLNLGF